MRIPTASVMMAAALLGSTVAGAQIQIPDEARVQKVAPGLHVIMGVGGNVALVTGPDGVLLVDDDMPPLAPKIAAAIATVTEQPVSFVFNTHWHFDHAGGNRYFAERGAIIVAQDNVHKRLSEKQFSRLTGTETPPAPAVAQPVISFADSLSFHLNGLTIRAEHVAQPAHTDGDAVVFFDDLNVVHMGDTFFNGRYPVIDLSAGGTAEGMLAAVDAVLPRLDAATVVIPGHGPVTDRAGLQAFRDMLGTVNQRITGLLREGKTADEVIALRPTVDYDEQWAWSFMPPERWTRLMYDSAVASAAEEN